MLGAKSKGRLRTLGYIDRYVMRLFASSYLSAFFLVVGLFLIIEVALKLEDFLAPDENGVKPELLLVLRYYVLKIPFLYLEMSPYVTLVAGMFTASKMTRFNEVVAVLNSGVSIRRLFGPVLVCAALLALAMFGLREWATQDLGLSLLRVEDYLEQRRPDPVFKGVRLFDDEGHAISIDRFYLPGVKGGPARFEGFGYRQQAHTETQVVSVRAGSFEDSGTWRLEDGSMQSVGPLHNQIEPIETLEHSHFTPEDVVTAWKGAESPMQLSFSESIALLRRDPSNVQYRTLFHYHITFPLAGLVLLAVGLPFVLGQGRGKAAERVSKGFFLCVLFFGLEFISRTLGLQGQLAPLFAAWLPLLGFGALGCVLFGGMRS